VFTLLSVCRGRSDEDVLTTARTLAALPLQGIKIHSLLALEGTALGEMYKKGTVSMMSKEKYVALVADILEILPTKMVIQRLNCRRLPQYFSCA